MQRFGRVTDSRPFPSLVPFIVVACLVIASVMFVGLKGDFPLNDDWSYAGAVRSLVWAGNWRPMNWTSANVLTQSLWAAPFCALSSCSFESLRVSTLVAAILFTAFSFILFARTRTSAVLIIVALFGCVQPRWLFGVVHVFDRYSLRDGNDGVGILSGPVFGRECIRIFLDPRNPRRNHRDSLPSNWDLSSFRVCVGPPASERIVGPTRRICSSPARDQSFSHAGVSGVDAFHRTIAARL